MKHAHVGSVFKEIASAATPVLRQIGRLVLRGSRRKLLLAVGATRLSSKDPRLAALLITLEHHHELRRNGLVQRCLRHPFAFLLLVSLFCGWCRRRLLLLLLFFLLFLLLFVIVLFLWRRCLFCFSLLRLNLGRCLGRCLGCCFGCRCLILFLFLLFLLFLIIIILIIIRRLLWWLFFLGRSLGFGFSLRLSFCCCRCSFCFCGWRSHFLIVIHLSLKVTGQVHCSFALD
mmetsp:Transcript_124025/g.201623  ORF Transcript_124025/g.201623 Transcript_124025/m.201623 type:complete len:230 (+) Transcript_124025:564-1253(+)